VKDPEADEENVTVPVGAVDAAPTTVAVQLSEVPRDTVKEVQVTNVKLVGCFTVSVTLVELTPLFASPL